MSRKGGEVMVVVVIVLVLLSLIIGIGAVNVVKAGPLDGSMAFIDVTIDTEMYEEACTKLENGKDNFESDATDEFTNVKLDFDVDDISYFAMFFKQGWGTGWFLEWWRVTCVGTDGEKELMRYGTEQWINNKVKFGKTENKGYMENLGCADKVNVYVKTGDLWWSGTDGEVDLCYMKERSRQRVAAVETCGTKGGTCYACTSCPADLPRIVPKSELSNCNTDGFTCCASP